MRWIITLLTLGLPVLAAAQGAAGSSNRASFGLVSGHQGPVTTIAIDEEGGNAYTAGNDGFVVRWDLRSRSASERYQLSPYGLSAIALRPGSRELAVVETDGLGLYRVSAWDFSTKRKLFTLRFKDAVQNLAYSPRGGYLMVSRTAVDGVVLLDPSTGTPKQDLGESTGSSSFAAAGKSEKSLVSYSPTGSLSYWDLSSGKRLQEVPIVANLQSPALFSGNRYLYGILDGGIAVYDALSGVLTRKIPLDGDLLLLGGSSQEQRISYLRHVPGETAKYGWIDASNLMAAPTETPLDLPGTAASAATCGVVLGSVVYLGEQNGEVLAAGDGASEVLSSLRPRPIDDAALVDQTIYALGDGRALALPADPRAYTADTVVQQLASTQADRIETSDGGPLVVWDSSGRTRPLLWSPSGPPAELPLAGNLPILASNTLGNLVLFLDAAGIVSVFDLATRNLLFSYRALGLLDAVFADDRTILLGKSSAVAPFASLVSLNFRTGETAPIDLGGQAVVRLHRGMDRTFYAVTTSRDSEGITTRLLSFLPSEAAKARALVEYRSEDVAVSIADTEGSIATTIGKDGATIFGRGGLERFQRTEALPVRLSPGGQFYLAVDSDGGLAWHDSGKGTVVAELRVYPDRWVMVRGEERLEGVLGR